MENLAFRPVIGRLARTLLDDPRAQTQTQMAATVGAAREMVNRSLHTLEREGVIGMEGASRSATARPLAILRM